MSREAISRETMPKEAMSREIGGFSLIEVLISALIMAVGVSGVANMHIVSLQINRDALLRDQALQAANGMLDRIRANPLSVYAPVTKDAEPVLSANCASQNCTHRELASFDIAYWKCSLNPLDAVGLVYDVCTALSVNEATLPQGQGAIVKLGRVHEVSVFWHIGRAGKAASITLQSQIEAAYGE